VGRGREGSEERKGVYGGRREQGKEQKGQLRPRAAQGRVGRL
jgi:hypothetical protein